MRRVSPPEYLTRRVHTFIDMAALVTSYPDELNHDRLGFAFCVALALHAAFILGISFNREDRSQASPTLEITLAQHRSQHPLTQQRD